MSQMLLIICKYMHTINEAIIINIKATLMASHPRPNTINFRLILGKITCYFGYQ